MQLDFKALNLSSLVAGIIDEFANGLQERKINCVIENFGSMPVIQGDKDALRKAFYHVIVNAIKYTPDQGHITIKGSLPGMRDGEEIASSVQVTVKDSGIGIDPKDHELIFDRFYQTGQVMLHSSGKTKFKGGGSGLGLAVSRGIIEAHGGQIWVESAGHDETTMPGSSFHIVLPIRGQG
jgi:signal transduction histidine kinase